MDTVIKAEDLTSAGYASRLAASPGRLLMRANQSMIRDLIEQVWNVGNIDAVEAFVASDSPSSAKVWTRP